MKDDISILDQGLEDRLFRAILAYPKVLPLLVGTLKEENFSSQVKARLYHSFESYYLIYKSVPNPDLLLVTIEELYPDQLPPILGLLKRIVELPAPEYDWIVSKLDLFIKTIQLQKAIYESSKILKEGNYTESVAKLTKTITRGGLLHESSNSELELDRAAIRGVVEDENVVCCPTRIYALDRLVRGIYRKELFMVMSPLNVGKSWFMVHTAISGLISGKHVLYLTLEMSRKKVLQRFLQAVSSTVKQKREDEIERDIKLWDKEFTSKSVEGKAPTLLQVDFVKTHLDYLKNYGGCLSIGEYYSGQCTVQDIERAIAVYDVSFGKTPDMILVDSLAEMKIGGGFDPSHRRLGLTEIVRDLRRVAQEYNCGVVITHQANRQSITAKVVGSQHTGESLGIIQVADTAVSLMQTKEEYELSKMRIHVMRSRSEKKWGSVELYQNLDTGQFCLASKFSSDDSEIL